jgi:hypothetical protein
MTIGQRERDSSLWEELHRRFGHRGLTSLKAVASALGYNPADLQPAACEVCIRAKAHRQAINKSPSRIHRRLATEILDRLHADLMGPFNVSLHGNKSQRIKSLGGNLYVLVCVEEYSGFVVCIVLRSKSDANSKLISVISFLQTQTGRKLKEFHTDGAKELGMEDGTDALSIFLDRNGTLHSSTQAYSPALNGVAERMNRTIMEMVRASLLQAGAHPSLWGEAVLVAARTHNSIPRMDSPHNGISPYQLLLPHLAPKLDKLHVFGCDVWITEPLHLQTKLGERAFKAMFVGYSSDGRLFKVLDPSNLSRPFYTRDVKFNEDEFSVSNELVVLLDEQKQHDIQSLPPSANSWINPQMVFGRLDEMEELFLEDTVQSASQSTTTPEVITSPEATTSADDSDVIQINQSLPTTLETIPEVEEMDSEQERVQEQERDETPHTSSSSSSITSVPITEPSTPLRRSSRISRPVDHGPVINLNSLVIQSTIFGALIAAAQEITDVSVDPTSYKNAIKRPDGHKWLHAVRKELDSMQKNKVWKVVDLPKDASVVKCRWVFKTKLDESNKPVRFKARLVAKGFSQVQGINYDETYAPVAKYKSLKLLMAIVNQLDLEFKQIDFETAFLNAPLDYDVYMELPEGMSLPHSRGKALLLLKAIYGLKQSPRLWNQELHNYLVELEYLPITADKCIYTKRINDRVIILSLYVDDTAIAYSKQDEAIWERDKSLISKRFPISDLGNCEWLLGMEIQRDRINHHLVLSQRAYIERVLKQFNMLECKTTPTPMSHQGKLDAEPLDGTPVKPLDGIGKQLYQSIVGSLLYAACLTRMDLCHATSRLARFCSNPAEHHLQAARHALRYLSGTRNLGLTFHYSPSRKLQLDPVVYPDASWISEIDTGRSYSGVMTMLNGNPIHWWSKLQSLVALSSTEAEYVALGEAAKDAVWLREWINGVLGTYIPIKLRCDNQAAIKIVNNETDSARTRHYTARHHYVRDLIKQNQLSIEWTSTDTQAADLLTKSLDRIKLQQWVNRFLTDNVTSSEREC